mmetsp:Transcript_7420/g.18182  ORF Transcript_7420/g.18182 Transcript_7420/m.18182 type:complete len:491 (+) Transcript_7420:196-1668(+)|eukprot:CAMPEP_0116098912 /NCGR_PEP_ID=MMETSP0327-20121206/11487_1 /TAXON_ID=44447 /ORGANISM="Pseudo-nitzschia delicatissima, Strain B596" /LENGTH=490 /DNA_ID=CAMNT_0003590753 /DNA_START=167 /DNA_END=1639 /DNA_ORIENTATION=+
MNISNSFEENSKVPSLSSENDTKNVSEAISVTNMEKTTSENPEKATPIEKNDLDKPNTAAPTDERDENVEKETKPSENGGSESEPAMKEDKADKTEEEPTPTDTTESPGPSTAGAPVESAEATSNTDVTNDTDKDEKRKEKPAVVEQQKKRTRKKWKKPVGKPNRPLSAYNLYFQKERAIMLGDAAEKTDQEPGKKRIHRKTHGKIGFADMAKIIGGKWKKLPEEEKEEFVKVAVELKEKYAKDLAEWREEQKKKAMMNSMASGPKSKMGKLSHDNDDLVQQIAEDRENLLRQHQAFRMQMMQEMQVGHLGRFPGEGQGRQMPSIDYLRNMQDDRTGQFFGRNRNGANSSLFSHYPSAAEGSGRDLYQQMVAMTSGPDGPGREPDQFRKFNMAPMGGATGTTGGNSMSNPPLGNNGMGNSMGMVPIHNGAQMPNAPPHHQYEMDRYHMRHQNQMHGMHQGPPRGMPSHEAPSYNNMEASRRRFQQHSHYN